MTEYIIYESTLSCIKNNKLFSKKLEDFFENNNLTLFNSILEDLLPYIENEYNILTEAFNTNYNWNNLPNLNLKQRFTAAKNKVVDKYHEVKPKVIDAKNKVVANIKRAWDFTKKTYAKGASAINTGMYKYHLNRYKKNIKKRNELNTKKEQIKKRDSSIGKSFSEGRRAGLEQDAAIYNDHSDSHKTKYKKYFKQKQKWDSRI